jgi:hypothetical protein
VACHVLEVGGEQVSFDATSDAKSSFESAPRTTTKREISQACFGQDVASGAGMKERDFSKFDEQRGNVYENKGSTFHSSP